MGAIHSFKNETDTVAHLLCVVVPAGLEKFFTEIGIPTEGSPFLSPLSISPEQQQQLEEVAKGYGQELFLPDYLNQ